MEKKKETAQKILKMATGGGIFLFYEIKLQAGVIGVTKIADRIAPVNGVTTACMLLIACLLWLYGASMLKRFPELCKRIYWVLLTLTPLFVFLLTELSWNPSAFSISLSSGLLDVLTCLFLEIFFVCLLPTGTAGLQLFYLLAWLTGVLNYYLLKFRGQPLLPTDFAAASTAVKVAGQYSYEIGEGMAYTFLLLLLFLALFQALGQTGYFEKTKEKRKRLYFQGAAGLSAFVLCLWVGLSDFKTTYLIGLDYWNQSNTYKAGGFASSFITFLQNMKVTKPEGYTSRKAAGILEEYAADEETAEDTLQPTIITIMNETFSDLSVLGELSCTDDDLSFLHSLQDDPHTLEYGWNYVSTRGGGTSTTEFEYLTGDSMAFTNGINPYSGFNFTNVPSMVSRLKEQGYTAIAMHPEYAGNWRRSIVYPKLGFDEFLSIDSFADSERTVWDRVSDLGDYQKLLEVLGEQTEPSFIFNVTMQNHGGYGDLSQLSEEEIVTVDEAYSGYSDFQMYESLMAKADEALSYLISALEEVDTPVILCFFGDHQPSLSGDFENALKESGRTEGDTDFSIAQKTYAVPYFIWSNYEIAADYSIENNSGEDVMSTNYLGAVVQKYAGLSLSAYDSYLLEQREELPVFNFAGYLGRDGSWYDGNNENEKDSWKETYQTLTYYSLFDKKKQMKYF